MNNNIGELIDAAIDLAGKAGEADQSTRRYLGASVIGHACSRFHWYAFHWAFKQRHSARMLRLFDRGHKEEARFVQWLELIGCEVQRFDPATIPSLWHHPESDCYVVHLGELTQSNPDHEQLVTHCLDVTDVPAHVKRAETLGVKLPKPRQFGFKTLNGHHAGSCDGRARYVPGVEQFGIPRDAWIMLEFKTYNTKSFCYLKQAGGVIEGKKEHVVQMQRYMHEIDFPLTLYGAVNKNDDDIHWEFVQRDGTEQPATLVKVSDAIYSPKPLPRLSNSPSWFECKYCDARANCHFGAPLPKNCRTCTFSEPADDGRWKCNQFGKLIPEDFEPIGCDFWNMRTD